jgi:hypothetical protein
MLRIAARFCGPPDSGNGGYCAGVLAAHLPGPVEVTLRKPPPLERELNVEMSGAHALLKDGAELLAEARSSALDLDVPAAPSFERASELSRHYVGHARHHFPTCFVCGPARAVHDGLRIFPGSEHAGEPVAAPWSPDASLLSVCGVLHPALVWAALDCAGYFASGAPDYPVALLGRMTAQVIDTPRVDEPCVVVGWPLGREGRKLHAGTALFDEAGKLYARARQVWILVRA